MSRPRLMVPPSAAEAVAQAAIQTVLFRRQVAEQRFGNVGPKIDWAPLPGPQTAAYECAADETFYGGAAGGGKTDLMLGLALTKHRRSIIFRREHTQLKDLVERSREIIGDQGRYNANEHLWRDLPGGRWLELGGVHHEKDLEGFKGRAHDLKAFDEVSDFSEKMYTFLIGWARTTIPGQRVRVVAAGNPPTVQEGEWVIRRWAPWLDPQHPNPAVPGELRWYATIGKDEVECEGGEPFEHDGELIYPRSRTFVPARLADNPYLAQTGYGSILQGLPEPLRSQLLYGDFSVGVNDDPWQVIPTAWVRAAQHRWRELTDVNDPRPPDHASQDAVGVDVALGGKDQTVLAPRSGTWFGPLQKYPGDETPNTQRIAQLVLASLLRGGVAAIDAIGVGAGVYDFCREQARVVPIVFSERAPRKDKTDTLSFANLRAWAYWSLREALDPQSGDDLALPDDAELLRDLTAPKWAVRLRGVTVESKQDIMARLGRSPDCGDAVVLAYIATLLHREPAMAVGDRMPLPSDRRQSFGGFYRRMV